MEKRREKEHRNQGDQGRESRLPLQSLHLPQLQLLIREGRVSQRAARFRQHLIDQERRIATMSKHTHEESAHSHHGHAGGGTLRTSAQATLHCLTGCVIGEVTGLAIGVTLGLGIWPTIILATGLAYATGMTLGLLPVMKSRGVSMGEALRIIWIGEVISIGVMEIVMNAVDYSMGGMSAPSILTWMFWRGILFAVPAGFLAAWPVNYWLLKRDLKACH